MSLEGVLPSYLNSLSNLESLNLMNNSFTGPLPSLTNLTSLTKVYLAWNNFTSIPQSCFQGLTALESLILGNNPCLAPWTFPTDLTNSIKLETLEISYSNIVGFLPDIFHSFPSLKNLQVSKNNITGVLPMSFVRSQISYLWLNDQEKPGLSGTIEVLSTMTNLSWVQLQGNTFSGPIPDLSDCTNLFTLQLANNQLTGVVPPYLMNFSTLRHVSLEGNLLQGPLPIFPKQVNEITTDDGNVGNSYCRNDYGPCDQRVMILIEIAAGFEYPIILARLWKGNNPCKHWSYIICNDEGKITTINLENLNLTGMISNAFANLTDLRKLYLNDNSLKGPIPKSLTTLSALEVLDVSHNNLYGEVPKFSIKVNFTFIGNVLLRTSGRRSKISRSTIICIGLTGVLSLIGIGVVLVMMIHNPKMCYNLDKKMTFKRRKTIMDKKVEKLLKSCDALRHKRYSFSKVKKITNSFRDKLGEGGYGIVYKGSLKNGCDVAVKVLSESKGDGEEFINEVASISTTSHANIVSLLGFCYEKNKRALIYEFMPRGSLDKFVHKEEGSPNDICSLDWNTLHHITIGIAEGLHYLHEVCGDNKKIWHLDIKPHNILLNEDFLPKIADFGLAKIYKRNQSFVSRQSTKGTIGYMAPEVNCPLYGEVSEKSDIYSYGVLILELVEAKRNFDSGRPKVTEEEFVDGIYNDIEQNNISRRYVTNTQEETDIAMKIILVSLSCMQRNPNRRPSISEVLQWLKGSTHSVPLPSKPSHFSPQIPLLRFSDISDIDINTNTTTTLH